MSEKIAFLHTLEDENAIFTINRFHHKVTVPFQFNNNVRNHSLVLTSMTKWTRSVDP